MPHSPPFLFSLLILPLLAAMSVFIVVRRPRQALTWTFVGVMVGLIIFYLADVVMYQPRISAQAGLVWQFVQDQGANVVILSALALNVLVRHKRLKAWEWATIGFIVVRMVIDTPWLAQHMWTGIANDCMTPHELPRLTCPPEDRLPIVTGAIASMCLAGLFVSTAFNAPEPERHIMRRYMLWIALLTVGGGVGLQVLTLAGYDRVGIAPGQPATWLAILIGIRLFLALEEEQTGVRFPVLGWRILVWFVLLLVAVLLDLTWGLINAPVWTLVVLAAGMAGGGAVLVNSLARRSVTTPAGGDPSAPQALASAADWAPVAPLPQDHTSLRLYLFGPMRVVRDGETLPNTSEVWRSAKTRSLLVFLALRREAGATQVEIVDALWPMGSELDGDAERSSLGALRSYLSTLRRVLDPTGPRGNNRWIVHEGERFYLRSDDAWVDVWEFERLAREAEALLTQGRQEHGLACWRQAIALYPSEGLLPDEAYLPAPLVEPAREGLRQRWLAGLRCLARAEQIPASAADLWETVHQAEPLDGEAHDWLVEHYRRLGNRNSLRLVLQRRGRAEDEFGAL